MEHFLSLRGALSYQTPLVPLPTSDSITIQPSHPLNSNVLPVGRILTVQVSSDPSNSDQKGVLLQGRFLPAQLPSNVTEGAVVAVRVVDNAEQLILKLLPPSEQPNPLVSILDLKFRNELKAFLADQDLDRLRLVLKSFTGLPTEFEPSSPESSSKSSPKDLIAKLLDKNLLLTDKVLENPEAVFKSLIALNSKTSELLASLSATQKAVAKIAENELSPKVEKFLKALIAELDTTSKNYLEIAKTEGSQNSNLQSKETTASHRATNLAERAEVGAPAQNNVSAPTIPTKELIRLRNITTQIDNFLASTTTPETTPDKEVRDSLVTLKKDLSEAVSKSDYVKVNSIAQSARAALASQVSTETSKIPAHQGKATLDAIENLVEAKESLNNISTLMRAIGEPVFVLFPFLADGIISKLNLVAEEPDTVDPDEEKGKDTDSQGFEKIDVDLHLPSLGAVRVSLAHKQKEVYLNLILTNDEATEFISQNLDSLKGAFRALGYEEPVLSAKTGLLGDIRPAWVQEFTKTDITVA